MPARQATLDAERAEKAALQERIGRLEKRLEGANVALRAAVRASELIEAGQVKDLQLIVASQRPWIDEQDRHDRQQRAVKS